MNYLNFIQLLPMFLRNASTFIPKFFDVQIWYFTNIQSAFKPLGFLENSLNLLRFFSRWDSKYPFPTFQKYPLKVLHILKFANLPFSNSFTSECMFTTGWRIVFSSTNPKMFEFHFLLSNRNVCQPSIYIMIYAFSLLFSTYYLYGTK